MTVATRYETITVAGADTVAGTAPGDGDRFDAYCAVPESGRGPGVIVFQEIFGINDNMRGLAERLAEAGFVALVPDMFWRVERRFERKDESGMPDAFAIMSKFDFGLAEVDIAATHAHLLSMPECTGQVGAIGFCLGGGLSFLAAASSRVEGRGIDAAVCYYGSAINDMLGRVDDITAPVLYHYGARDAYIPEEKIAEVEKAVTGRPGVEFHRYDAGHAFSNWDAPSMYDERAAAEAWPRTIDFLHRHLG